MNRKIGRFKLWQLLAIGGALGLIIYEYEKKRKPGAENPELAGLAASNLGPGIMPGGGGENGVGGVGMTQPPPGEPGPIGAPGPPGAEGPAFSHLTPEQIDEVNNLVSKATQPLAAAGKKPAAGPNKAFPLTNPATGKKYRIEKEHGKTVHVYQDGHKVVIGGKKKPAIHRNPLHKPSHGAPRKPISHERPKPLKPPKPHPAAKRRHEVAAGGHPSSKPAPATHKPARPKPKPKRRKR